MATDEPLFCPSPARTLVLAVGGPMTMHLQGLVFDFDGLIVNTERPGFVSWEEIFQEYGKTLTLDDWRHATGYVGMFDPARHLEYLLGYQLDWSQLAPRRETRNWELTLLEGVLPGIEPLMREATRQQIPIGVASNSGAGWVEQGLERLGLRSYVQAIVTRDMVVNAKPAPDSYLKTLQTLRLDPRYCVALEDSEPGSRAAKQAGLKVVAIPNEFSARQDLSFVDLRVDSAAGLSLARLEALVAGPVAAEAV